MLECSRGTEPRATQTRHSDFSKALGSISHETPVLRCGPGQQGGPRSPPWVDLQCRGRRDHREADASWRVRKETCQRKSYPWEIRTNYKKTEEIYAEDKDPHTVEVQTAQPSQVLCLSPVMGTQRGGQWWSGGGRRDWQQTRGPRSGPGPGSSTASLWTRALRTNCLTPGGPTLLFACLVFSFFSKKAFVICTIF